MFNNDIFVGLLQGKNNIEKAKELLDIISAGTAEQYSGFCRALEKTDQHYTFLPSIAKVARGEYEIYSCFLPDMWLVV